jgi:hypothetical protein
MKKKIKDVQYIKYNVTFLAFLATHLLEVRRKRDLLQWQKRPVTVAKETCYSGKRDLLQWQTRPIIVAKETYYSGKRDLL